jgi:peptidoglycan/LPS O-acetylase OafA/YrhL
LTIEVMLEKPSSRTSGIANVCSISPCHRCLRLPDVRSLSALLLELGDKSLALSQGARAGFMAENRRVFGLDLVRAMAILGVLQVHFLGLVLMIYKGIHPSLSHVLGGLGVELFFALSGFLIGGLLIDVSERSPTLRGWLTFMLRRWLRTIPLYLLTLAALLVLTMIGRQPRADALLYLTFTQNLAWPMPDNWFGVSWSLTIEEWFYLLFSALLIALAAIWPRRALIISCTIFIAGSLILRFGLTEAADGDAVRRIVIFRLDAIAYGAAVAGLCRFWPGDMSRARIVLLALGAALVILTTWFADLISAALVFTFYPIGLAACLPAIALLAPPSAGTEAVIRWVSTRSYGLYLTHWVVVVVVFFSLDRGLHPVAAFIGMVAGWLIVAEVLYRFFELPIMRRRPRQYLGPPAARASPLLRGAAERPAP